ncbi:hypothetical protein BG006_011212 [Podila minutissima]|uniref:Uncharacterized protein n=1 Tax=Podila minutissima TaxID=64525 RepID=A0A9P5SG71_9FUNG|nr:hypothetical protein BG006_011212 [Podila minutissima]
MNTSTTSTKSCVSNGRPACVQGFVRDKCQKCTMGSFRCNMCHTSSSSSCSSSPRNSLSLDRIASQPSSPTSSTFSSSSSSSSCIFCHSGRKACDGCFGLGYVQRICLDCIKDKHRRHRHIRKPSLPMSLSLPKALTPAKETPQDNNSDSDSSNSNSNADRRTTSSIGSTILRKLKVPALFSKSDKDKTHRRRWSLSSLSSRHLPSFVTAA